MDGIKDWLFPSTPVEVAIRVRPLALALFRRLGIAPWDEPKAPLSEACERRGIDADGFVRELAELPVPAAGTPWRERPAYFLVDYLTAEHRDFLHKDLPAIRYLLDMGYPREGGGEGAFRTLAFAVEAFGARLRAHVIEEEEGIFPALLRSESLLGGRAEPGRGESGRGGLFVPEPVSGRLVEDDGALIRDVESFFEDAMRDGSAALTAGTLGTGHGAGPLLRALHHRLHIHARLETEILFPMAARIERELHAPVTV